MKKNTPEHLSDRDLLDATLRAAAGERRATVELIALLAELDRRRLYLSEGCASLFTFCTQVLHLSEHAAYHRIEAARAVHQVPAILNGLSEGALTLTTVAILRPHLTRDNYERLLAEAHHKTKREVEYQVACLAPKPEVKSMIRRIASPPAPVVEVPAPVTRVESNGPLFPARSADRPAPPTVAPVAADRYLIKVTVTAETHGKFRRAQELLRHSIPTGDPAAVIDRALTLLVQDLERKRTGSSERPRSDAEKRTRRALRHVPAAVRREVWARDQGRCAFEGSHGRCTETGQLEFHHLVPFACGGRTDAANLALRCRAHNHFEGELAFGPRVPTDL